MNTVIRGEVTTTSYENIKCDRLIYTVITANRAQTSGLRKMPRMKIQTGRLLHISAPPLVVSVELMQDQDLARLNSGLLAWLQ